VYSLLIVISIFNNGISSSVFVMDKRELIFKTEELCRAEIPSLQEYIDSPNWNESIERLLHHLQVQHTSFDARVVCSDRTSSEYSEWLRGLHPEIQTRQFLGRARIKLIRSMRPRSARD